MQRLEQVAKVCHEANRAYCETLGDYSQQAWDGAPAWQRESALKGVEFHLSTMAKGQAAKPSASHESWLAEKLAAGWKYGPVKDPEKKEHPCCVPFEQLPAEQQRKDYIFVAICEAFYYSGLEAGTSKA